MAVPTKTTSFRKTYDSSCAAILKLCSVQMVGCEQPTLRQAGLSQTMRDDYVITIHPGAAASVPRALAECIQSDARIRGWWNYLPNVYLVTANCDSAALTALIKPVPRNWPFLVMKVDLDDTQGCLPDQAWDWIHRRVARHFAPSRAA